MTTRPRLSRRCGAAACVTKKRSLGRGPESRVPVGLGHLGDGLGHEPFAGCVHEQIEPAELVDGACDERPGRLHVGEVAVGPAGREDRPALGLEARGDGCADPSGSPSDERAHGGQCRPCGSVDPVRGSN